MIIPLFSLSVISGCTFLGHEEFDCPYQSNGSSCKSLKDVHKMIKETSEKNQDLPNPPVFSGKDKSHQSGQNDDHSVQRSQEERIRIWIGPFQDEQGNFHEPSVVHTIIQPPYWKMNVYGWR